MESFVSAGKADERTGGRTKGRKHKTHSRETLSKSLGLLRACCGTVVRLLRNCCGAVVVTAYALLWDCWGGWNA